MHFNNSVIAANFIKKILERRDKKNIQVLHQPSDKKSLHINLIEKDGLKKITHHVKFSREHFLKFRHPSNHPFTPTNITYFPFFDPTSASF